MSGKPELLAPAGSRESLVAAVENGADAVYLGGRLFNARQSAGNFTREELARAVEFAHVRGVKLYVTVNTLLDERELDEAAGFLFFIQQIGADAAIVQDLGLAGLAGQVVPELPLHASTQMTVHNLPSALVLKESGIDRVIAARELSLAALEEMVRGGIKVE
ncbi:MAG: Collagenase and related protease, partial [Pelotomaculum thermopropionicum]